MCLMYYKTVLRCQYLSNKTQAQKLKQWLTNLSTPWISSLETPLPTVIVSCRASLVFHVFFFFLAHFSLQHCFSSLWFAGIALYVAFFMSYCSVSIGFWCGLWLGHCNTGILGTQSKTLIYRAVHNWFNAFKMPMSCGCKISSSDWSLCQTCLWSNMSTQDISWKRCQNYYSIPLLEFTLQPR